MVCLNQHQTSVSPFFLCHPRHRCAFAFCASSFLYCCIVLVTATCLLSSGWLTSRWQSGKRGGDRGWRSRLLSLSHESSANEKMSPANDAAKGQWQNIIGDIWGAAIFWQRGRWCHGISQAKVNGPAFCTTRRTGGEPTSTFWCLLMRWLFWILETCQTRFEHNWIRKSCLKFTQ